MIKIPIKIKVVFFFLACFFNINLYGTEFTSNIEKKQFRFLINADPQIGEKNTPKKSLGIRNELLGKFVTEVNKENVSNPIDFVVYNGDLVNNALQDSFNNFTEIVSNQKVPTILVHGNHDGHDNDPKFFNAQQSLSGYQKLNYSFEHGNWYFIFIGAQQKYKTDKQKKIQLAWLNHELTKARNKQVMLFMHYHIMPVGLSQMEYYTYWPIDFKNNILDLITGYGNVKYVFSGHVHTGVKASIKSSLQYKGVKFINCPTPAKARPFGEEFKEYEVLHDSYFRTGFYLDVRVNGDNVELIGRKISHKFQVKYPQTFNNFIKKQDIRFFSPESRLQANKQIFNFDFNNGFEGWKKSFRYQKDINTSFSNVVENKKNNLILKAPWGGWSQDEYMESYQIIELDMSKQNTLTYNFMKPDFSIDGAGGYIKLVLYSNLEISNIILFHWGSHEKTVKTMHKAWFYNMNGARPRKISTKINKMITDNKMLSVDLSFDEHEQQILEVDLRDIVYKMTKQPLDSLTKISISHGVWTKVASDNERRYSKLSVDKVQMKNHKLIGVEPILLNKKPLNLNNSDKTSPYQGDVKLKVMPST